MGPELLDMTVGSRSSGVVALTGWLQDQITFGNLLSIGSILVAFGYQMRRLQQIELDITDVKRAQDTAAREQRTAQEKAAIEIAATYTRRDVLAETLQSMNGRLANIEMDIREVKHITAKS